MTNHFKISLLGLLGISTAMAGGLSQAQLNQQDALINPYTDKRQVLEMTVNNDKVDVSKTTPSVTMQKWNGADHLDVSYSKPAKSVPTRKFMTNQIETPIDNQQMVTMKPTDDGTGFNVDVTLSAKPSTNVFTYTFDNWQDKDFFYQPPLNVEMASSTCTETDCGGSHRPENVVGSYAVYSKVHANHILGQTNYETGKLFHIYRPQVTDANGSTTWASLDIKNGVMSVTVPQDFLDKAVYPVVVDPTFGYGSIGASEFNANLTSSGGSVGSIFQMPEAGSVTSMTAYFRWALNLDTAYIWGLGVYTNASSPVYVIGSGFTTFGPSSGGPGWYTASLTSTALTASTNYSLVFTNNGDDDHGYSTYGYIKYDAGTTNQGFSTGSPNGYSWDTSISKTNNNDKYSIYATYTASGTVPLAPQQVIIKNVSTTIKSASIILKAQ